MQKLKQLPPNDGGRRRGQTEQEIEARKAKEKAAQEAALRKAARIATDERRYKEAAKEWPRQKRREKFEKERQRKMGICPVCTRKFGPFLDLHICLGRPTRISGNGNVPASPTASSNRLPESGGSGSGD